ncbi:MAG TPA: hypothetical protein VFF78_04010, partial [Anaerolineaceae bacterium]|nr:hypothetical protein [Anaerolineaceae bacterium]
MSKIMKRVLGIGATVLAFLVLGWMFLVFAGPFRPDSFLYGLQHEAEVLWGYTIPRAEDRVSYYLTLLDRRTNDLNALSGKNGGSEMIGLQALNHELDHTLYEMTLLPRENMLTMRQPVLSVV